MVKKSVNGTREYHGMTGTRTYRIWKKMIERCTNPRHASYPKYGAKGIAVCQRWRDSFSAFLSDMGTAPAGQSLDRINTLGGYEPTNCRWLTPFEQARNARHNHWVDVYGRKMILTDASSHLGMCQEAVKKREFIFVGPPDLR